MTSFEYLPRIALEFVTRHIPGCRDPLDAPHPAYVLCEVSTARDDPALRGLLEDTLGSASANGEVLAAVLAESGVQRDALWRLRESVPEAQRHEGASIKHDVSVPIAALPAVPRRGRGRSRPRRAGRPAGGVWPPRRRQPALQFQRACGTRADPANSSRSSP